MWDDLLLEIKQDASSFTGDEQMEMKVLKQVLTLVEDKISEVKNQAVKWCVSSPSRRSLAVSSLSPLRQSGAAHQDHPGKPNGNGRRHVD